MHIIKNIQKSCSAKITVISLLIILLLLIAKSLTYSGLANNYYTPSIILNSEINVDTSYVRELISKCDSLYNTKNTIQARDYINEAFDILNGKQDSYKKLYADIYHQYGKILFKEEHFKESIDTFLKCISLKKELYDANNSELANTYNFIGMSYAWDKKPQIAVNYYMNSIKALKSNNLININLFDSYNNLGILYANNGNYLIAYDYLDTASTILNTIYTSRDKYLFALLDNNMGMLSTKMGKIEESNKYYNLADSIYTKLFGSEYIKIANLNLNQGSNSYLDMDFEKAELYFNKAIELYKSQEKPDYTNLSKCYFNLSSVYLNTRSYDKCIKACNGGLKQNTNDFKVKLYINLAKANTNLNKIQEADYYYIKAQEILSNNNKFSIPFKVYFYRSYARFLVIKKEYDKAYNYFSKALELTNRVSVKDNSKAYLISELGYIKEMKGEYDSSLYFFNQSIDLYKSIHNLSETIDLNFTQAYLGKAQVFCVKYRKSHDINYLIESSKYLSQLIEKLEKQSISLGENSKLLLNEKLKKIYDQVIGVNYELFNYYKTDEYLFKAFNYTERSKNSVLLSTVNNLNALETSDIPIEITNKESQLTREINAVRMQLIDEREKTSPSRKNISFYEKHLLSLINEKSKLINYIDTNFNSYYYKKYNRDVISITDLRKNLGKDQMSLNYKLVDSSLFIIAISKDTASFNRIKLNRNFFSSIELITGMKNKIIEEEDSTDFNKFVNYSYLLWQYMIQPVYNQIKGKSLLIIPDGILGYIPFEMLLTNNKNIKKLYYSQLPYMIKEFPISYSYSATLRYNSYFNNNHSKYYEAIIFAPSYNKDYQNGKTSQINLKNLPYAKEEATEINKITGGKIYSDSKATKANFIRNSSKYNVVHLAMHAILDDSIPSRTRLVFYSDTIGSNSSLLKLYELYRLKLNAELVTLSACNTGSGKVYNGEGIMSMARGFLMSGASSIVMTLWNVQDKNSSIIMKNFYKYLSLGINKDKALQKAKLDYLNSSNMINSHPFYWSEFILLGNDKAVTRFEHSNEVLIISFLILYLLGLFFFFIRSKKKKIT